MFLEPQGKMTDILCDPHPLHWTTSTSIGCNSNMGSTLSTNGFARQKFFPDSTYDRCVNINGS